ncbi:hypothetical protein [Nitrospina watsonii]|uniref:Uncharacterized protein n=1 Tax=Nitrospina watsonii TaxID=1323948 RepID=A0ABM9HF65_9BACT|nr:hypothetical protein [Nitrospina watsonii]CAI2718676.1 conserved protein of unknown function [Nitrospina watsonii]
MERAGYRPNILPESVSMELEGVGCREAVRIIDSEVELAMFFTKCRAMKNLDLIEFETATKMTSDGDIIDT